LEQRKVFEPIRAHVHIEQKTVKHPPLDKLYDSFITLLAGAHGPVQINTLLRADKSLQLAFGRKRCAEQSVVQQTLDACTPTQVAQMEQAMQEIYRTHSRGSHHDYRADWQILDVDLSGWLCGKKAAFARHRLFCSHRSQSTWAPTWPRAGLALSGSDRGSSLSRQLPTQCHFADVGERRSKHLAA
jgi:hypothetical protein